jgi:hypothetical protein
MNAWAMQTANTLAEVQPSYGSIHADSRLASIPEKGG